MKVIFKNPVTGKFEVGIIYKKIYGSKGKRFHLLNEKGSCFTHLPSLEDCTSKDGGYVDFELTATCMPHISTNLNLENQANYADSSYLPPIRKLL